MSVESSKRELRRYECKSPWLMNGSTSKGSSSMTTPSSPITLRWRSSPITRASARIGTTSSNSNEPLRYTVPFNNVNQLANRVIITSTNRSTFLTILYTTKLVYCDYFNVSVNFAVINFNWSDNVDMNVSINQCSLQGFIRPCCSCSNRWKYLYLGPFLLQQFLKFHTCCKRLSRPFQKHLQAICRWDIQQLSISTRHTEYTLTFPNLFSQAYTTPW